MSIHRYAAKVDKTQATLVRALESAGIQVWPIRQPCDLLLRFWCKRHQSYCWQTLEVKTNVGKKDPKPRVRREQEEQNTFLRETDTPIAVDFDTAWRELNLRHTLGSIDIPCVLKSM